MLFRSWYGLGRFWIEGFRTDSLCLSGIGGLCEGSLRVAQLVSLLMVIGGVVGLAINHHYAATHGTQPKSAER